jgi:GT2 family glycosyltransferase
VSAKEGRSETSDAAWTPRDRPVDLTVVICTRDRAPQLRRTLAALDDQTGRAPRVTVVDQSDELDPELARRAERQAGLTLIRDSGRGLSRARNLGWLNTPSEWLVFLDDDCIPEPAWLGAIEDEIAARADADYVSCEVEEYEPPDAEYKAYSIFSVSSPTRLTGRWTRPSALGYGACYAVRRSTVERLGGWDERLGAGAPDFPASDDMDFNFRLMRSGGVAYLTPHGRVLHDQWRPPDALAPLYRGYMAAACGYAMKHARKGDVRGGLWLWSNAFRDMARAFASAAKHRSVLRLRIALAKLRGLLVGSAKGLRRDWSGPEMGSHGGDPER